MKVLIHLEMKSPYLISDQNGSKSLTFGVAHTPVYSHFRRVPPLRVRQALCSAAHGLSSYFSKILKVRCFQILLDDDISYLFTQLRLSSVKLVALVTFLVMVPM